jgi:hypothetical protein
MFTNSGHLLASLHEECGIVRQGSALRIASWWHRWHDTSSDRTPLARMLPSVIGGPARDRGRVLMPERIPVGWAVGKLAGLCCGLNREAGAGQAWGRSLTWLNPNGSTIHVVAFLLTCADRIQGPDQCECSPLSLLR